MLCRVRASPCSIPKGGLECVTETVLGKKKKLKRKEGRERDRGTGKGEERKEGGREERKTELETGKKSNRNSATLRH